MELGAVTVLFRLFIGPDQEETAGGNACAGGDGPFVGIGQVIGEGEIGEVDGLGAGVVKFEPIVELAIERVGDGGGVAGHPFVDGDGDLGMAIGVGAAGGWDIEPGAFRGCGIGEGAVGFIGARDTVVQIIDDGWAGC